MPREPDAEASGYGGIVMEILKGLLLHIGVICSGVCIIAKVLDWYNPFMDFTSHVWYMQIALYFAVIILALIKKPNKSPRTQAAH